MQTRKESWEDPLIEELHKVRELHGKNFNYDIDKIYEDLVKQEEEQMKKGVKFISLNNEDNIKATS